MRLTPSLVANHYPLFLGEFYKLLSSDFGARSEKVKGALKSQKNDN